MEEASSESFASEVSLLGALPIASMVTRGRLRLSGGELRFTPDEPGADDKSIRGPASEFHSPTRTALGLQVWHGHTRLRFSFGQGESRGDRTLPDQWVARLLPVVGQPPDDARVRRAWPAWAWLAAITVLTVALTAAAVTLFVLFQ